MTLTQVAAAAAGAGCGLLNAVVGGGTLVSFPVLMSLGVPPVAANATNTMALAPGYLSAAVAQRAQLTGQRRRARLLVLPAASGGAIGAILLVLTSDRTFRVLVPVLIATATVVLAAAPRLRARLGRDTEGTASAVADARWLAPVVGGVAVYGGFFGAGIGLMLLAVLAVGVHQPLPRSNALKQILSLVTNLVAAAVLAALTLGGAVDIRWDLAAALALGNVGGGHLGGRLSTHLDHDRFRLVVVAVGVALTCVYAIKEYT